MKIGDRYITYILEDFDSFYKLNILQGDSATGKTCLCEVGVRAEKGMLGTSAVGNYKIHTLSGNTAEDCNNEIKARSNVLIVVDEDSSFLSQDGKAIQSIIRNTTNKFLIITRDRNLKFLSIPINAVWAVRNSGKYNFIERLYKDVPNLSAPVKFDSVLLEDRKSSYFLFRDYFPNIKIITANGKDNVGNTLNSILLEDKTSNILVVVDSCAFGLVYDELNYTLKRNKNVKFLSWECYEEYILRSPNFKGISICKEQMLEADYEDLLSGSITYNKQKVSKCIAIKLKCSECKDSYDCKYKVHIPRRDNYIHSELKNIVVMQNSNEQNTNEIKGF